MSNIARCWVAMSDDDEQTVSGVVLDEPTVMDRLDDGFEWVEYVRSDIHRGAVEALREIKHVAAIEAPPVSDGVPAKVWKIAFDALGAIEGR